MSPETTSPQSEDVDVSEVHKEDLDANAAKAFRALFENGLIAYFQDEDSACLFQRMWRGVISVPKHATPVEGVVCFPSVEWISITTNSINALSQEQGDNAVWINDPSCGSRKARYHWRQGRNPDRWIMEEGEDVAIFGCDFTHFTSYVTPSPPHAIAHGASDVISRIETWQRDAGRRTAFDVAQLNKHVGYQLEEMAELLEALNMSDDVEISDLRARIDGMATRFKTGGKATTNPNRQEIVDASCDLIVFGVAQMMVCGYMPLIAMDEVQRSNDSKRFSDGSLRKSEHGKVLKSEAFFKPNLDVALANDG